MSSILDNFIFECSSIDKSEYRYCHHFEKGNYKDAFILAGLCMLISLGMILVRYPIATTITNLAAQAKASKDKRNIKFMLQSGDVQKKELILQNNFGGWTFDEFTWFNAFVVSLYFIAKILLFKDNSYYIEESNKIYNNIGFGKWINANTILISFIFNFTLLTSLDQLSMITQWRSLNNSTFKNMVHPLTSLSTIIFLADVVCSIVLICIKYGYLVYSLYQAGVGALIVCILTATICFWGPCVAALGLILVKLFAIFRCCINPNSAYAVVLFQIPSSIIINIIMYFIYAGLFAFIWLLYGGVPESTVIMNDSMNQEAIAILFIVAVVAGILFVLFGLLRAMCGLSDHNEHKQGWGYCKEVNEGTKNNEKNKEIDTLV